MTWTLLESLDNLPAPSLDSEEFRQYIEGRLFRLTYRRDGSIHTIEATMVKTNPFALLVQHGRGKVSVLIERDWFMEATEIKPPVVVTKIIVRQRGPVTLDTIRQHLADNHGTPLSAISDDAEQAMIMHDLSHGSQLGHKHGAVKPRRGVPTPEEVSERAAELNDIIECESCGYRKGTTIGDVPERTMYETEDLIAHCDQCKDEEEYAYVRQI